MLVFIRIQPQSRVVGRKHKKWSWKWLSLILCANLTVQIRKRKGYVVVVMCEEDYGMMIVMTRVTRMVRMTRTRDVEKEEKENLPESISDLEGQQMGVVGM